MTEEFKKANLKSVIPILKDLINKHRLTYRIIGAGLDINLNQVGHVVNYEYEKVSKNTILKLADLVNHKIEFDPETKTFIDHTKPKEENKYDKPKNEEIRFWQLLEILYDKKPDNIEIEIRIK